MAYPVLTEKAGEYIAQFKGTVVVQPKSTAILSGGQELYNKLLQVYDEFGDMKKELRSHTVTKIFGHDTTQVFELPAGDTEISLMKDTIKENILDTVFTTKEDLIKKILELDFIPKNTT